MTTNSGPAFNTDPPTVHYYCGGINSAVCGVHLSLDKRGPIFSTHFPDVTCRSCQASTPPSATAAPAEEASFPGVVAAGLLAPGQAHAAPAEEDPARCRLQGGDGDSCAACNNIGTHAPAEEEKGEALVVWEPLPDRDDTKGRCVKCAAAWSFVRPGIYQTSIEQTHRNFCPGRAPSRGEVG